MTAPAVDDRLRGALTASAAAAALDLPAEERALLAEILALDGETEARR